MSLLSLTLAGEFFTTVSPGKPLITLQIIKSSINFACIIREKAYISIYIYIYIYKLHVQGAVAVRAQEGQEELFHVQGQEGRL